MILAASDEGLRLLLGSIVIFLGTLAAVAIGTNPLLLAIRRREREYGEVLNRALLLDISPRMVTIITAICMFFLAAMLYSLTGWLLAVGVGLFLGVMLPWSFVRYLRRRRLRKLEEQLVSAIQTLASGVRAGLNLVQAMQMIARDAPKPISQEFAHLLREYEYGVPFDEAMAAAAGRIGSNDFQLLFAALRTHRERGGNLGETLYRIAASIREIQRLERQVETLTAQGRATARWLGAMPMAVLAIAYLFMGDDVKLLFTTPTGNWVLVTVVFLNLLGWLWIRKIMAVDI
jgi:tight adherence protein B